MTTRTVITLLIAAAMPLAALQRPWKSTAGNRGFQGELIKRDASTVTIRNTAHKEITLALDQLHPEDLSWVNINFPLAKASIPAPVKVPDRVKVPAPIEVPEPPATPDRVKVPVPSKVSGKGAVFDQLAFGDNRDQVLTKLKASQFVELTIGETFIGRSGLNGIFRTRKQIGGLNASLFFDWSSKGELKELTLQTENLPARAYQSQIEPSWKEFIVLLTTLYGKPVQQGALPGITSLADGSFSPSHLWALENNGSALLGTARDGDNYQLVVRFTQKKISPVALP